MLASTFRSKIPVHALNIIFFFQLHNKYMTQQSTQEQEKREYIARQEHQKWDHMWTMAPMTPSLCFACAPATRLPHRTPAAAARAASVASLTLGSPSTRCNLSSSASTSSWGSVHIHIYITFQLIYTISSCYFLFSGLQMDQVSVNLTSDIQSKSLCSSRYRVFFIWVSFLR